MGSSTDTDAPLTGGPANQEATAGKTHLQKERMPPKDDESALVTSKDAPKSSSTTTSATMNDDTSNDDDDDVVLQKENSAWDSLKERFRQGAANGRYLDLSSEEGGVQELGVSDAAQSFASTDSPNNPSAIVHPESVSGSSAEQQQQQEEQSPLLLELGGHVSRLVERLKNTRETLMTGLLLVDITMLTTTIHEINYMATKLQRFVNRNSDAVVDSEVAMRRIENMNLLIHKANALISGYNSNNNNNNNNNYNNVDNDKYDVVLTRYETYRNEEAALILGQETSSKRTTRSGLSNLSAKRAIRSDRLNPSVNAKAPAPSLRSSLSRKRKKRKKEPEIIVIDE